MKIFTTLIGILCLAQSYAQNTLGLISLNEDLVTEGYYLIMGFESPDVYLLNNCGEVVHMWAGDEEVDKGGSAQLLEDGTLAVSMTGKDFDGCIFANNGGFEKIEIKTWENETMWAHALEDPKKRMHHDYVFYEREGNQRIAVISWETIDAPELDAVGIDTTSLTNNSLWVDYIFELDLPSGELVWEWHVWDHIVQEADSTKLNYGLLKDNPRRINALYDFTQVGRPDYMHSNAIDYDPQGDFFVISSPYFSELYVIDRSTTIEEAKTGQGGKGGYGGDFMYRWGNPQRYDQGGEEDKQLHFQHNTRFLDDFILPSNENYGLISVFNNRAGAGFSTINILDPEFDSLTWSFPITDNKFGPNTFKETYTHPRDERELHSNILSGAQFLENGNLIVSSGRDGYLFEMTTQLDSNEVVFEYIFPIVSGVPFPQGEVISNDENRFFKVDKYSPDHPALVGKDLTEAIGWLEVDPNEDFCLQFITSDVEDILLEEISLYPNPTEGNLFVKIPNLHKRITIEIYNAFGQSVLRGIIDNELTELDVYDLQKGIYFIKIDGFADQKFVLY